jgi:Protein of unknown function (DUF3551)
MRLVLFMLGILLSTAVLGSQAEAQNYPWCAYYSKGCTSCAFTTLQQCMADVSGIGGFCQPNNTYVPPPGTQSLRQKKSPN